MLLEFSIALIVATALGLAAKKLHQPPLLGFILSGLVLGYMGIKVEAISWFSELGIVLLMFMIGLEMELSSLSKNSSKSWIFAALQISLSSLLFSWIFGNWAVGVALSFASTAIVMDYLSRNRKMNTVHGSTASLTLILQDIVAVVLLSSGHIGISSIPGILLMGVVSYIVYRLIDKIMKAIGNDSQLALFVSVSTAFAMAALSEFAGLGPAFGSFLAGLVIAPSTFSPSIEGKVKSLKEFFLALFFIYIGSSLPALSPETMAMGILLGFLLMLAKFSINLLSSSLAGMSGREKFLLSLELSGLGEFTLLSIAMLDSSGMGGILPIAILASFVISPVLLEFEDELYSLMRRKDKKPKLPMEGHIIMFGCHRTGYKIAKALKNEKLIIVDSNPETVEKLKKAGFRAIVGDMNDQSLLEELNAGKAEMLISTIPVFKYNRKLAKLYPKARKVCVSKDLEEALKLHKMGFEFVLVPEIQGGEEIAKHLKNPEHGRKKMEELKRAKKDGMF